MSERKIDEMIDKVRERHLAEKNHRQRELEDRRSKALRRIGDAAIDHDLPIGQSSKVEAQLVARLQEAQRVRISEAEAMSDLAVFNGDITSELYWWEIKTKEDTILWKGYVINKRIARIRFEKQVHNPGLTTVYPLDINVRRACQGEIIASLYVDGTGVMSMGASNGENASVRDAVAEAYVGFINGVVSHSFTKDDVPQELLDKVDKELEDGKVLTNSRSQKDAATTQRELEDGEQNEYDV